MKIRVLIACLILTISSSVFAFKLTIYNKTGGGLGVGDPNYCYLPYNIPAGYSKYNDVPYDCATTIAGLKIQFYGDSIKTNCSLMWCISANYYNGVLTLS